MREAKVRTAVRVVLVDDDERMLDLINDVLTEDGFHVVATAGTASAALVAVDLTRPDVVVLDYVLPDGDGLDIAEAIREERPDQQVVIFSSLFDLRLQRDVEMLGLRYVEKVDGIEALESAIRSAAVSS